jgi:hypothetical protein
MTPSPEPKKRRRWPWVLLLVAVVGVLLVWKLRSDAIADRERLRVWRAEAKTFGIEGMSVSFGPRLRALDFLVQDRVAIAVHNDAIAAMLMEIQSPPPAGLILVDEGISAEVAKQLKQRYPRASMPKLKGAAPPPGAAATAPPS